MKNAFYKNMCRKIISGLIILCCVCAAFLISCKTVNASGIEKEETVPETFDGNSAENSGFKIEEIMPEDKNGKPEMSVSGFQLEEEPSVSIPVQERPVNEDGTGKQESLPEEKKDRGAEASSPPENAGEDGRKKEPPKEEAVIKPVPAAEKKEENSNPKENINNTENIPAGKENGGNEAFENTYEDNSADSGSIEEFDIKSLLDGIENGGYSAAGGKSETVETEEVLGEPEEDRDAEISRRVNVAKGQRLEISYPAEGWVYLGEETSQSGLKYLQRKLQRGDSLFTFSAEKEGSYILNFSYFDVFSDDYISDAVSVTVTAENGKTEKTVTAPEYSKAGKTEAEKNGGTPAEKKGNVETSGGEIFAEKIKKQNGKLYVPENSETGSGNSSSAGKSKTAAETSIISDEPDVFASNAEFTSKDVTSAGTAQSSALLEKAEKEIAAGDAESAVNTLEEFFAVSSIRLDEGWFLKGKAYEINGKLKSIKTALNAYKFLVKAFPESPLWNDADARIRYIEKFYVNIK